MGCWPRRRQVRNDPAGRSRCHPVGTDIQNIPEFQDLPLGDVLRERTGLPVVVDNDVNALTLAEWTFGQGKGCRYMNVCNPELVVLGGGVMQAGEILMEPALQWTGVYAFRRALAGTRIVRSGLSKESGVLGAAALFLYEAGRGDDPKAGGPRREIP